jgi:hypothetical protein
MYYYWLLDLIYEVSFAYNSMKVEFQYFHFEIDKNKSLGTEEIPEIISSMQHRDTDSRHLEGCRNKKEKILTDIK